MARQSGEVVQLPENGILHKVFFAALAPYNVRADGKTITDAAISSGSPTLTSASANFTASDAGKRIVVIQAGASSTHLYTTILSFVNATTVTLATNAGATVSGGEAFYATDETAPSQQCINDANAVNGTAVFPEGDIGLSDVLTGSTVVEIVGQGVKDIFGVGGNVGTLPSMNDEAFPSVAPYLRGTVFVQTAANKDIIQCTVAGGACHVRRLGLRFAGRYLSTGHGLNSAPSSGYGNVGGNWEDVHVFGHDGNHYGFVATAVMYGRHSGLFTYGGGGIRYYNGTAPEQPGNIASDDCLYNTYVGGSAHAAHIDGSGTGVNWSAITFTNVNPQVNLPSPVLPAWVPVPTNAQQVLQTTNGNGMNSMLFLGAMGQTQITGSKMTFPSSLNCYRTNSPGNVAIGNVTPTNAVASGSGYQNLYGTTLLASFMFAMQPAATGNPNTTLGAVVSVGALNIPVASSAGFSAGQVIQIGDASHDGGVLDFAVVSSIPDGTHITVVNSGGSGMIYNHSSGATVQAGAAAVLGQLSQGGTWPGNPRVAMVASPIGAGQTWQQFSFIIPSSFYFRLDFGNATRVYNAYSPTTV